MSGGRLSAMLRIVAAGLLLAAGRRLRDGTRRAIGTTGGASAATGTPPSAYYRQALGRDPSRIDVKIALQRAMAAASAEHIKRARELEAQDQLPGAIAEYRLAAELDPTNTLAAAKANELERTRARTRGSGAAAARASTSCANRCAQSIDDSDARPAHQSAACSGSRTRPSATSSSRSPSSATRRST